MRIYRTSTTLATKGLMLLEGLYVEKDVTKAIELIKKSSDMNNPYGQAALGSCYYKGQGIEKDEQKGLNLLEKSAARNCRDAYDALAHIYYVKKIYNKAFKCAEKGTRKAGNVLVLGSCYFTGEGVEKDVERGLEFYKLAANLGDSTGQFFWGVLCENGYGSYSEAFDMFKKAADQGESDAMAKVGEYLLTGKAGTIDRKAAEQYLRKAAELGSNEAKDLINRYSYLFW